MQHGDQINHSSMEFPVNVSIRHLDADTGELLSEQHRHNRVLKYFGLYSWFRFIQNDFFNDSIKVDPSFYIPQYLAVGSNSGVRTGPMNTSTTVQINDTGLYHEITQDSTHQGRIPITSQNIIEDRHNQDYLKITYTVIIPKDRFVNETIGEFALMTTADQNTAFARVSGFNPIVKVPNTIVQVLWEVSVRSIETLTDPFRPVSKIHLMECIDAGIRVLREYKEDPEIINMPDGTNISGAGSRQLLQNLLGPYTQVGTAQFYIYDTTSSQDLINGLINRPFNKADLENINSNNTLKSGLVDVINLFESWQPEMPTTN